jgi:hypothetical protein
MPWAPLPLKIGCRRFPDGRRSPEYMAWIDMKKRCYNENFAKYHRYGGRGIRVCERWYDSFENFIVDMGLKPGPEYTLERKNNDLGYSPENCVWATYLQQNANFSFNRNITIKGQTYHLAEWCRRKRITLSRFYQRVKSGMTDAEAIFTPIKRK